MRDPAAFREQWVADALARYRRTFDQGDYTGVTKALVLCLRNHRPLPDWLADVVIQQACYFFNHGNRGRGKHGGWVKSRAAIEIHRWRFHLADWHLKARRKKGKDYVSELACLYEYGTPTQGGENIVTRKDIFEFVSLQLKGDPAQGSRRRRPKRPVRGGE
jgi:hypothetical protein